MGLHVKLKNDISYESTHQIRSTELMRSPKVNLYQSCSKKRNFDFGLFFFSFFFFVVVFLFFVFWRLIE